tara:strand:- start:4429 stop:5481 length:1053 start_codon:yes stop_codon:yes gene_type:complete
MSIVVKDFDANKQRLVGEEHLETNELLNQHESNIYRVIRELQLANNLTKDELKSKLDSIIRLEKEEKPITELLEYAIMYKERVCRVRKNRTLKNYQSTIGRLEAYEIKIGKKLLFNDINIDFYHSLMNYCKVELEQSTNTFGCHIKHIKTWMNTATEEGINSNLMFRSRGFATTTESVNSTYLTLAEIELLKQLDLEGNHLEKVRDIFLVACFTGLRIGDYHKICFANMINENTMLKIFTEKTSKEVVIPIHPFVYETLKKYRGILPMISHQKFNKYIKDVIALAKIDKYVTSHCARRSFATNAFKSGVPSLSIMQITGHTTEKNFLKYIRVTKEENAKLISSHSFFKLA